MHDTKKGQNKNLQEATESLLVLSDAVQMILIDEEKTIQYKAKVRCAYMVISDIITEGGLL